MSLLIGDLDKDFERSLDYLRRDPLDLPKEIRPEMQDIFQLGKARDVHDRRRRVARGPRSFGPLET